MAKVLVFAESREGRLKKAGLEVLSEGRRLADASGGTLTALLVGDAVRGLAAECGGHGAEEVLVAEGAAFSAYAAEAWRDAAVAAIARTEPGVVLFPASAMGLDFAPRVAARLGVGLLTDVVALRLSDGRLEASRPVFAGKALATATLTTKPALATLRNNVFAIAASPRAGTVVDLAVTLTPPRARVVATEAAAGGAVDVAEAAIVVSGGRGLKAPEHFALVRDLADALGGAVGASRAVVDAGWIDHAHQVGQTGKTVSPKLYVALGISGAIQHIAGMSSSKVIVAVNKDAEAPIFKLATYGVVGDVFEVVPALTAAVRAYQAKHG